MSRALRGAARHLWARQFFSRSFSWRRATAPAPRSTEAAGRPGAACKSARQLGRNTCVAWAKVFSGRSDALWRYDLGIRDDAVAGMSGAVVPRATACSTPRRAPHTGTASVGALAAPASAALAAGESAGADGVLRPARHAHGHAAGR